MKKKHTVLLAVLAAVALTLGAVPDVRATPRPASLEAVSTLRGEGLLGRAACYTCIGGALASTTFATSISPLLLSGCLGFCEAVM